MTSATSLTRTCGWPSVREAFSRGPGNSAHPPCSPCTVVNGSASGSASAPAIGAQASVSSARASTAAAEALTSAAVVEMGGANAVAEDDSGAAVELTANQAAASTTHTGLTLTRPSADDVDVV